MEVTIDCAGIKTRPQFHAAFAAALAFPHWYGNNLDALHDCLTTIQEETRLHLSGWNALETALGPYSGNARRAILHAAEQNPHLSVSFD